MAVEYVRQISRVSRVDAQYVREQRMTLWYAADKLEAWGAVALVGAVSVTAWLVVRVYLSWESVIMFTCNRACDALWPAAWMFRFAPIWIGLALSLAIAAWLAFRMASSKRVLAEIIDPPVDETETLTPQERRPVEPPVTELLAINTPTGRAVHIERTRRPQHVNGFGFSGRLLDALEQQAREERLTRQPLLDAGLITTADYMQMTDALVGVGYLEQNGRGYRWTEAGHAWITLPHSVADTA